MHRRGIRGISNSFVRRNKDGKIEISRRIIQNSFLKSFVTLLQMAYVGYMNLLSFLVRIIDVTDKQSARVPV